MLTKGPLNLDNLDQSYTCVVQLLTQAPGVLHQITLDPNKIKDGLIRIGDTPGDEATGWQQNIHVHVILGTAKLEKDGTVTVTPLIDGEEE
jgi:hypothetical protein